jgi:hypothetical protein
VDAAFGSGSFPLHSSLPAGDTYQSEARPEPEKIINNAKAAERQKGVETIAKRIFRAACHAITNP